MGKPTTIAVTPPQRISMRLLLWCLLCVLATTAVITNLYLPLVALPLLTSTYLALSLSTMALTCAFFMVTQQIRHRWDQAKQTLQHQPTPKTRSLQNFLIGTSLSLPPSLIVSAGFMLLHQQSALTLNPTSLISVTSTLVGLQLLTWLATALVGQHTIQAAEALSLITTQQRPALIKTLVATPHYNKAQQLAKICGVTDADFKEATAELAYRLCSRSIANNSQTTDRQIQTGLKNMLFRLISANRYASVKRSISQIEHAQDILKKTARAKVEAAILAIAPPQGQALRIYFHAQSDQMLIEGLMRQAMPLIRPLPCQQLFTPTRSGNLIFNLSTDSIELDLPSPFLNPKDIKLELSTLMLSRYLCRHADYATLISFISKIQSCFPQLNSQLADAALVLMPAFYGAHAPLEHLRSIRKTRRNDIWQHADACIAEHKRFWDDYQADLSSSVEHTPTPTAGTCTGDVSPLSASPPLASQSIFNYPWEDEHTDPPPSPGATRI